MKARVERLTGALSESLEQQTATAEILRVISGSPTDVAPIFDTIAESAWRLCAATRAAVYRFDGALVHFVAHHGYPDEALAIVRTRSPSPPDRSLAVTRAILDRTVVHIPDVFEDTEHRQPDLARAVGVRSLLSVPMLRDGKALGAIVVGRGDPGPFSGGQIALLQTFADQAVIAIENVRLFKELEARNRDLTATSEILQVISHSPTDVQPAFDTIAERAMRLCDATTGVVTTFDGTLIHIRALANMNPGAVDALQRAFPLAPSRGTGVGRVILTGEVVQIRDVLDDPEYELTGIAQAGEFRSILGAPMLHGGSPIGAIFAGRPEAGAYSEEQIQLLKTFADQAVIAIENVRLFNELQEKNTALTAAHAQVTESLEQQTATSELLKVIGRSTFDLQPVFDALAENAVRLCEGHQAAIFRFDGQVLRVAAFQNASPQLRAFFERNPIVPGGRGSVAGRAAQERRTVHVHDVRTDPEFTWAIAQVDPIRTVLMIPMLRTGELLGLIGINRLEVRPFSDNQIALLETFADQAVIAIENSRLLTELRERTAELTQSVGELTALGAISQALSSTLDVDVVLDTIVTRANDLIGADGCTIFEYDEAAEQFHLRATRNLEPRLVELARGTPLRRGDQGILGRLPSERQPVQVPDITVGSYSSPISAALIEAGYRAVVAVPLIREDHLIGALTMNRKIPGEFPPETIELLQTFATQSALAIQNARLFREIEQKSRELEAASRHKSEFLANMSHELRTPLNAIIGFSEVLSEGMFGEINEKQAEYLRDILESGRHLLSLINDILDLSKIEAGRMELEAADFDLPSAIDTALILVRERATRRGITLGRTIDDRLGIVRGDERKLKQVLLNLLSNALKFTPEGGRIDVSAHVQNGAAEIAVADTGVGIAPEDQEAIFEEFRQVGTADKKVEGTGLGLALSRKFIELHGGRISVESEVGKGSTFRFTLPMS